MWFHRKKTMNSFKMNHYIHILTNGNYKAFSLEIIDVKWVIWLQHPFHLLPRWGAKHTSEENLNWKETRQREKKPLMTQSLRDFWLFPVCCLVCVWVVFFVFAGFSLYFCFSWSFRGHKLTFQSLSSVYSELFLLSIKFCVFEFFYEQSQFCSLVMFRFNIPLILDMLQVATNYHTLFEILLVFNHLYGSTLISWFWKTAFHIGFAPMYNPLLRYCCIIMQPLSSLCKSTTISVSSIHCILPLFQFSLKKYKVTS